jgi:hypothetical protein
MSLSISESGGGSLKGWNKSTRRTKEMLKKVLSVVFITIVIAAGPVLAENGCKTTKFFGSYTRVDLPTDVFLNGTVIHQYFFQLVINADGTASQYWTGSLDYPINTGTGSPSLGSWACRPDGRLVVTFLASSYNPTPPGPNNPLPDVSLAGSQRATYLFTVDDENTLTRVLARGRNYTNADDPTNAAGGTLGPLSTRAITYKRFVASDSDLLLP